MAQVNRPVTGETEAEGFYAQDLSELQFKGQGQPGQLGGNSKCKRARGIAQPERACLAFEEALGSPAPLPPYTKQRYVKKLKRKSHK